ncbi:hypothetical protein CI102_13089 [Trichoderma harzianum]|nr:hypothetical protein CI102_13089 [Trichoderma harzianum]
MMTLYAGQESVDTNERLLLPSTALRPKQAICTVCISHGDFFDNHLPPCQCHGCSSILHKAGWSVCFLGRMRYEQQRRWEYTWHCMYAHASYMTCPYVHTCLRTCAVACFENGRQPESDRVSIQAASHRHFLRAELWGKALEQKRVQELVS